MIRDTAAQDRVLGAPAAPWRKRLVWIGAAVVTALLLTGVLSSRLAASHSVRGERLRFDTVSRGTLVRDAAVNGRIVAADSPLLYAPATSTVNLKIRAGDQVRRGDVLAQLQSPELDNLLKREQASFDQLDADVARQRLLAEKQKLLAQRDAEQATIELRAAERLLQRRELGFKAGAVAEVDVLTARDAVHSSEVKARQATQATELEARNLDLELRTRASQLERQRLLLADARRRVEELQLRSPVDGMVGTLAVADRSVVPMNAPLMTVIDLSRLEVEIEVPESYADDLGTGIAVEIRIGTAAVAGTLSAISPEVVRNQVLARVRFNGEQPAGLRQHQRVSARVLIEERADVLMVERGPFIEQDGGQFAYVLRDGIAERVPISIGAISTGKVEIRSGLQPGDRIVVAGTDTFERRDSVRIIQ